MRTWIQRKATYACARVLCATLALFAFLFSAAALAESDGMLRVRLARLGAPSQITMRADCTYHLSSDASVRVPSGTDMTVTASDGRLALSVQGRAVSLGASARLVREGSGKYGLTFLSPALSNKFCGDLYLAASGDAINAGLRIYIEDYLYGVVGCEMSPSSGLEALKAQAIVARNHALRQKANRSGSDYDLSDSGDALSFRGYNGASEYADVVRAVDETRGQLLYYGDSPATCYFCDSNGGQTESTANALGEALPYSVVMDDPYDYDGGGTKKTASLRMDASDLREALESALIAEAARQLSGQGIDADPLTLRLLSIDDIAPESPMYAEPSRLYRSLAFALSVTDGVQTARVTVHIPTYGGLEQWYELGINDEDNETIWVSRTDRSYEITFRRSGSGLGMSQRGTQAMARSGLSCGTILEYYYPGTALRTLTLNEDSAQPAARDEATPAVNPIANARLSQKSRLYERADTTSTVLTTLPAGATVAVYAVRKEWAAIGSGDLYGFVHAEGLTSFALVGVTAAQVLDEAFAQVNKGPVEVLQLPVSTALPLETLDTGASVRLTAYTDQWALVVTDAGTEGFIPRNVLTFQAGEDTLAGDIVAAQDNLFGLLTEDAGLYVNADDSIPPRRTLSKGDYVQILAYNSAWANVRTRDNDTGFVKLNCLSAVQQVAEPQATPAVGGGITTVTGKVYRYVSAEALSLFESHSTESAILATLKRGDRVRLGAYNDQWACVLANGQKGFVLLSGLSETPPEDGDAAIEGGAVTKVKGEQYATVVADDTPLYPSWSDADVPVTRLKAGTRVRLGAYNSIWACVNADGTLGYVRVEALELAADAPADDNEVRYLECEAVTTANAAMYASAKLEGAPVADIPKGAAVHVFAFNRRCAYVDYNGQQGFVALRNLERNN